MKRVVTKEQIEELYLKQNKTSHECQDILGISRGTWKKLVKKYSIKKLKRRETITRKCLLKLYLYDNLSTREIQETLQIGKKSLLRLLHSFNIVKSEKQILTNIAVHRKHTLLERYGVTNALQSEAIKIKHYNTMKANGSFNKSKPEEEIYQLLVEHFSKDDVIRQYRSEVYPFNCDFYIKSLDLYLEFQGTWQHGKKPYDLTDPEALEILNIWKNKIMETGKESYKIALERYTVKDPLKRETAKKNNLNWKEFFTMKEFYEWFNQL